MRVLVTGGFGTVGLVTLREALARGHEVTALVRQAPHNERTARRFRRSLPSDIDQGLFSVRWGDMRDLEDVKAAVKDQDAVIHLAAILPPRCDAHPALCEAVNVGGTRNLIEALQAESGAPRVSAAGGSPGSGAPVLVHVSSVSVMGSTQHQAPPVRADDTPRPTDTYSRSKDAAEAVVRESALAWAILRLAAVMPTSGAYRLSMVKLMLDMALAARCEIVVDSDVAYALVQAAENLRAGGALRGKTAFIAGGRDKGCQMTIGEMLGYNLAPLGISLPRPHLFRADLDSYYLDWYDTDEGQSILGYQRHSVQDWQRESHQRHRLFRALLWPVRWPAKLYLELTGRRERALRP